MPRQSVKDPHTVADRQALNAVMKIEAKSLGTDRNYRDSLRVVAKYANATLNKSLNQLTIKDAYQFLTDRATTLEQSSLNKDRLALQAMLHTNGKLATEKELSVIKSEKETILGSRSYTPEQIKEVGRHQTPENRLSTVIVYETGIRAHEILTLAKVTERPADDRPALSEKFAGREGERYTVTGKGGLTREISLPTKLAERLEQQRLEQPRIFTDRGIRYEQYYDLKGGKNWSNSFSSASLRALNWSGGGHGLRHTYAQERMSELQREMPREKALEVVSQELGHFRPQITLVYLR